MKGSASDPLSMGNDPGTSYNQHQNEGITKVEGEETINGIPCVCAGLFNKDDPENKRRYTIFKKENDKNQVA